MAQILRHNDESVRERYIRNGGKEVKLFTNALKAFQCNNRIVTAQRKHLDYFLRGRIYWTTGMWTYPAGSIRGTLASPRVSSPGFGNDSKMMVINRRSTASDLSRQLSSATGTTVSRQTVYRRLGHIGLCDRRPVICLPVTATRCRLRLNLSREHALWTPQQWPYVMFSDESECNDDRSHLSGCHSGTTSTFISGCHVCEFLCMDENARPHCADIVDECLQSDDITRMDWPAYSPDLNQ
ncbi:transposable element Tcb1 transposase [Trichonephila clavipes]|nr:transposable element Tcb1 transposase [Trichonephila clavipes]